VQCASGLASEREISILRDGAGDAPVVASRQLRVFAHNTVDTIYSQLMQPLVRDSRKAHHMHASVTGCFKGPRPMTIAREDEHRVHAAHRMHVVRVTSGRNNSGDKVNDLKEMRAKAASCFRDYTIGDVVIGPDPNRLSRVATFTAPMTWQLTHGVVAHLASATLKDEDAKDEDALNAAATRWGTAVADGFPDIFEKIVAVRFSS
jgi:hypothetical protein